MFYPARWKKITVDQSKVLKNQLFRFLGATRYIKFLLISFTVHLKERWIQGDDVSCHRQVQRSRRGRLPAQCHVHQTSKQERRRWVIVGGGSRGGATGAPPPINFDRICFFVSHFVSDENKAQITRESIWDPRASRALKQALDTGHKVLWARNVFAHIIYYVPPQKKKKILDPHLIFIKNATFQEFFSPEFRFLIFEKRSGKSRIDKFWISNPKLDGILYCINVFQMGFCFYNKNTKTQEL